MLDDIAITDVKKFEGESCIVEIAHILFGFQHYIIDKIHMVDLKLGVGIHLHNQDIYIPRDNLTHITIFNDCLIAESKLMHIKIQKSIS